MVGYLFRSSPVLPPIHLTACLGDVTVTKIDQSGIVGASYMYYAPVKFVRIQHVRKPS